MTFSADGVKVASDFTNDRDALRKTVDQIAPAAPPPAGTAYDASRTLAAMETAVRMLGVISDKKALIYITDGALGPADPSLQSLINAAIRAKVALYPIDARGLQK